MNRTHPYQNKRFGGLGRWLAIAILPAMLIAGCGSSDDNPPAPTPTSVATRTLTATPVRTATPTPTVVNTSAAAACDKLESCKQCFTNSTGRCIPSADCAARVGADVAACINGTQGCGATALGDCLFPGCQGNDASGPCN